MYIMLYTSANVERRVQVSKRPQRDGTSANAAPHAPFESTSINLDHHVEIFGLLFRIET